MEGKPIGVPGEEKGATEAAPVAGETGPPEVYGVVELRRRVKDDGRALLLFTRPDGR